MLFAQLWFAACCVQNYGALVRADCVALIVWLGVLLQEREWTGKNIR
jgi:hypothetical protein